MRSRFIARLIGSWIGVVVAAAGSPALAQDPNQPAPPLEFWARLGDTTLARLTAQAFDANRDVRVAEARVRQARAARSLAALDLAPTVTVAAGYSRQRIAEATFGTSLPDRSLWDAELQLSWEIDVFGRLRRSLRGQEALSASARADVRDVQRLVAAEVATAYYELRGAEARLRVARDNAENQRRTLELTQQLLDAGRGSAFDTERAQAQLSSTLATVPVAESGIAAARYRIAVLIGRDPAAGDSALTGSGTLPRLPETLALQATDAVIDARADVRSAERRLAAETAFVGAAKADYLPRFSLGGSAGFTSSSLDGFAGDGTSRFLVGPVISWPAFNLGRVKAGVDAARALEAEARARYQQTVLLAREEAERSLVVYDKSRERLDRLADAEAASRRAADLARLRFEGGVAGFLEVLDAERSLLSAQDQLAQGRTDAATALVLVYRALAGGEPSGG